MADKYQQYAFRLLLLATILVLSVGTLFSHEIEGWNLIDSFYYCVVTLTTVGYGDFTPQTSLGRIAASIYILLGVGIIAGFVHALVSRKGTELMQQKKGQRQCQ